MSDQTILDHALGYMYDLRGEWDWKKDEPMAGNKAEYDQLCEHIKEMEKITGRVNESKTNAPEGH